MLLNSLLNLPQDVEITIPKCRKLKSKASEQEKSKKYCSQKAVKSFSEYTVAHS